MRALFEDQTFAATADPMLHLQEVGIPTAGASRRDLWFRFVAAGSAITVKAYATRAEAKTTIAPSTFLASATITVGAAQQEVTLTRNGTSTPDLTGLKILGTFSATPAGNGTVWGYTCSPDLVICDNLVAILQGYTSAGQALYGIDPDDIFTGALTEAKNLPQIVVSSDPSGSVIKSDISQMFMGMFPIRLQIECGSLTEPGAFWRSTREFMAAVESIVLDEWRRSYNEVIGLHRGACSGPSPEQGAPTVMQATVGVRAELVNIWSDRTYPR